LTKAYATTDGSGRPAIGFELDDRGAKLFAAITKAHLNTALAIVIDGKVVSAPVVRAAMGKHGIITGDFSEKKAKALAKSLAPTEKSIRETQ
jgi:preprotein translocase subunit SecD